MPLAPQDLHIQPSSGVPIYRQLVDQVVAAIAGGRLHAGETLPSVRAVAAELEIHLNTVSKAWSRLEADGVLIRRRGRGMAVAEPARSAPEPLADRRAELEPLLLHAVARARQLHLTDAQVAAALDRLLKENPRV